MVKYAIFTASALRHAIVPYAIQDAGHGRKLYALSGGATWQENYHYVRARRIDYRSIRLAMLGHYSIKAAIL